MQYPHLNVHCAEHNNNDLFVKLGIITLAVVDCQLVILATLNWCILLINALLDEIMATL